MPLPISSQRIAVQSPHGPAGITPVKQSEYFLLPSSRGQRCSSLLGPSDMGCQAGCHLIFACCWVDIIKNVFCSTRLPFFSYLFGQRKAFWVCLWQFGVAGLFSVPLGQKTTQGTYQPYSSIPHTPWKSVLFLPFNVFLCLFVVLCPAFFSLRGQSREQWCILSWLESDVSQLRFKKKLFSFLSLKSERSFSINIFKYAENHWAEIELTHIKSVMLPIAAEVSVISREVSSKLKVFIKIKRVQ